MNIVYTFDDGYTEITAVSILSMLENNQDITDLNLFVADCGISPDNRNKLNGLVQKFGRTIKYVDASNMEYKIPIALNLSYWTFTCYVRLFFSELFPDLDRVLHIDCDTIICGSLKELYYTNLEGNYCAGCYDCVPSTKLQVGLSKEDAYISNGVLIFDLKKMREANIQEKFVNYIVEKKGELPHLDQDVVNDVLKENIYVLPAKYNVMTYNVLFGAKCCDLFNSYEPYYTKTEITEAVEAPVIIHLVGYRFVSKPWNQPCYHPYNSLWKSYYKQIGFGNENELLKVKKKKYGLLRECICYIWNIGNKLPYIKSIEFYFEKKRIDTKCNQLVDNKIMTKRENIDAQ